MARLAYHKKPSPYNQALMRKEAERHVPVYMKKQPKRSKRSGKAANEPLLLPKVRGASKAPPTTGGSKLPPATGASRASSVSAEDRVAVMKALQNVPEDSELWLLLRHIHHPDMPAT